VAATKTEGYQPLGRAELSEQCDTGVRLQAGTATVEAVALAPDLFRVGMFPNGRPPDYTSEAIAKMEWELTRVQSSSTSGELSFCTGAATVRISLDPLRVRFDNASGRVFAQDDPKLGMGFFARPNAGGSEEALGPAVRLYKWHPTGERYFGCGERTGGLEKTASHQIFWNIDPPGGHNPDHNNLYTSIPFIVALQDGKAWGLFLANTYHVEFDLAHEDADRSWFGVAGGDLIYYVFCGPSIRSVLDRYTELTGRTPMPPLWALGYHQSRYSYLDAGELRSVAREFRRRRIPCDVLYLDIHYMDGYRVFTWDRERFPDPPQLFAELREQGFHVVTIIDPGVKVDDRYQVYLEGREQDFFCKTADGGEYHNVVWPGLCAFPDFTSSATRTWWGHWHQALLDDGVAGVWCDMDEPSLFVPLHSTMPDDVVHPGDGDPTLHAQIHNLYGSLMARATREALQELRPDRRPFVISRAGFAGLQRHALLWTGDNNSWWEHLWMSMPQLQNLGLSGLAWVGADIGGFFGDTNAELLTRWTELGVFQPFCRNHSALDTRRQEPWAFGEPYESIMKKMIQLRQRLIPYLYTVFEECHRTGAPILRPLFFENPDDETAYAIEDEFLLGSALLIAPITRHGAEYRHVYVPKGTWFHLWSGKPIRGPSHILAEAPLGEPPIYVRANTPMPLWPEMSYVGERPADPFTLLIFPAVGQGELTLYEDTGDGYAYQQGEYSRRRITCETSADQIIVRLDERKGSFVPERKEVCLEIRGVSATPESVEVDGRPAVPEYDDARRTLMVRLPELAAGAMVDVRAGMS
jgi:alpha-glucosidase